MTQVLPRGNGRQIHKRGRLGRHPQARQHLGAGIRAALAGVGANAAMLVLVGMTVAFAGAGAAESDAGRQLGFERLPVPSLVRARHDAAGCGADRRAIEVQPDAGNQALDMFFREACIRAGGAGFNAERAGVDAGGDGV